MNNTFRKNKYLLLIFMLLILSAAGADDRDQEIKDQIILLEQFINADFSSRLSIIQKTEKTVINEYFYRKTFEYLTLNKDYYENPVFNELYIEITAGILDYIYRDPELINKYSQTMIADAIEWLASAGVEKTYYTLFRIKSEPFPLKIKSAASSAIDNYKGSFYRNLSGVINSGSITYIAAALNIAVENPGLTTLQKGQVCETAMKTALAYRTEDHREAEAVKNILIMCVRVFARYRWSEASGLVIEYFDRLISLKNLSSIRNDIIEIINCLGIFSTIESAHRLNMYLSITNYFVETGMDYDSEIITAVINNLGKIGDFSSFESLSQVKKSGYTPEIAELADNALSRLGSGSR